MQGLMSKAKVKVWCLLFWHFFACQTCLTKVQNICFTDSTMETGTTISSFARMGTQTKYLPTFSSTERWTSAPHSSSHPRIIPERLGSVLSTDETATARVQRPWRYWIAFFINTIWDIRGGVRSRPGDNNWECWQRSGSSLGCNIFS